MKQEQFFRLEQAREHIGKSYNAMSKELDLKTPQVFYDIKAGKSSLSYELSRAIQDKFLISSAWLLTGEGEMLVGTEVSTSTPAYRVPLLPVYAQGGSFKSFGDSVQLSDCEMMVSPVQGADWAISIQGNSMEPEYMAGSKVLIKKVNEKAFIEWGRTYVLDTINGTVIKRLYPTENEDKIKCVSINEEYPPFEVELDAIHGIYRVLACVSFK